MLISRRSLMLGTLASSALTCAPLSIAKASTVLTKPIPSSGEQLPVVGLGSWQTFNVGNDQLLLDESAAVIQAFFEAGGTLIDSSPMYGSSQKTIGYGLERSELGNDVFSADKVWTRDYENGRGQMDESRTYWGVPKFDLIQVHNLVAWQPHLETLREMKNEGSLRYIGITTSHGRRHREMEAIMESEPLDFVQLTYNPVDREVENRLLPLAMEKNIAVIVNRPFQRKRLLHTLENHALPDWTAEINADSWAQVVLKYIVSHPAVTCAIPATTKVEHVRENLAAATDPLPDESLRLKIEEAVNSV